jgi:prepilin-type N-terminal cleavage/methylation domain-containing protein
MKPFFRPFFSAKNSQAGFTLVEMAVVAGIIGFLSTALIISFARKRIDIDQSANLVMGMVREAETKTVASSVFGGYNPCGYGFHYVSATSFAIYVGPNAASSDCSNINKNYQSNEDTIVRTQSFIDPRIEFKGSFNDVFFQPPDPKTYLNNDASLNQQPLSIIVGTVGTSCPTDCRTIYVYPSGKIQSQ